jgi:hypothetical protein
MAGLVNFSPLVYMCTCIHRAFENGVQVGRAGLGSIFVWAGGNGGYSNVRLA